MEDFNIVKIDGKPIEKLIEVVSNAIGTLYEPRQLVRIARAEAEAERIKAIELRRIFLMKQCKICGEEFWQEKLNDRSLIRYVL